MAIRTYIKTSMCDSLRNKAKVRTFKEWCDNELYNGDTLTVKVIKAPGYEIVTLKTPIRSDGRERSFTFTRTPVKH